MSWKLRLRSLFVLFTLLVCGLVRAQNVSVPIGMVNYADTILHNGRVVTMNDRSTNPTVGTVGQAMAIRDGKIQAVGSDSEILVYAGPKIGRAHV